MKYFLPTYHENRNDSFESGTRKRCNHRVPIPVAKLRLDAGWSVLRSCKYTSDRFLFESPNVSWKSVECDSVLFALSKFRSDTTTQRSANRDQLFAIEFFNNISPRPPLFPLLPRRDNASPRNWKFE